MNFKKELFSIALILAMAASGFSQTTPKYSDDRELFIGVPSSGVMPNIMILADNSISMRTAIYHPDYNPNYFYNHVDPTDPTSTLVTLENPTTNGVFGWANGGPALSLTKILNICGEKGTYTMESDYSAIYRSQANNNPRRWNITVLGGSWTAGNIVNKTVYWGCSSTPNSCTNSTTITAVSGTAPNLVVTVNPRVNPPTNARIYINPHWVLSSTTPNTAAFSEAPADCNSAGYTNTIATNLKLYGAQIDGNSAYSVLYDLNYLYWLAFHTNATQRNEISHWSDTGAFKHDSAGNHVIAGYNRIDVAKAVLSDVISELWTKNSNYNFGLASFDVNSEGADVLNNLQNANSPGVLNTYLNSIDSINPTTMTPLAEALADIWAYFKCGQSCENYMPESETNIGGCGEMSGTSGHPETSCPIQYTCQHNYVIIMTDGRSTSDNFSAAKYADAIFRQDVSTWGDGDIHDPATIDSDQPTSFAPEYCPNETCWKTGSDGTDFLDDVAYYIYQNDIFPDDIRPEFPTKQSIETFVIGFSIENQLLKETAKNGNGEFYPANDYSALKAALSSAITNIMLRNFAFASYTAPKRVTTAVGEGATFIGYFMPSGKEIWDGHLQSYTLYDKWFADADGNDVLSTAEQAGTPYELKATCQSITGKDCLQVVSMAPLPNWDAADKLANLTSDRNLYTVYFPSGTPTALNFTADASTSTLQTLMGLPADDPASATPTLYHDMTHTIVNKIANKMSFGDVFHSDIAYAGPPLRGKLYLQNYNPSSECDLTEVDSNGLPNDIDCYQKFRLDHVNRRKVLYVGTNVGIIHMIDANIPDSTDPTTADGGKEVWGFIPDEVLPSLKTIAIDNKFTFTTDGRLTVEDIYCHGATSDPWKTILAFGLKDGGRSFYALNITDVQSSPTFFWKFMDSTYSGNSWSKPIISKIRYSDDTNSYDRWVMIVSGGKAFNNENTADSMGKAVFVLDAANGDVIWMVGYNFAGGAEDVSTTPELDINSSAYTNPASHPSGLKHLTKEAIFNYCVPSAISAIDKDNDGYLDTIYFGNVAGHMFKVDLANASPSNWKTYLLYQTDLSTPVAAGIISAIVATTPSSSYELNITSGTFAIGQNVQGATSKAMGFITDITRSGGTDFYWIQTVSDASFVLDEAIRVKPYDPIFISPAIYKDLCMHYWVNFGTGDRLRSRTNTVPGKFVSFIDGAATPTGLTLSNLVGLTFSTTTDTFSGSTDIRVNNKYGWYFNFPNPANGEKLFDPDPIVLPDSNLMPHIFFNTYQYVPTSTSSTDCNAPSSGAMHFYEIAIDYCKGGIISGYREEGRISGGGMMEGSEYVMIEGGSDVGSVDLPGLGSAPKILPKPLPYTGGLIFLKEKKR